MEKPVVGLIRDGPLLVGAVARRSLVAVAVAVPVGRISTRSFLAVYVAPLYHETVDDPMEGREVVSEILGVANEILNVHWGVVLE